MQQITTDFRNQRLRLGLTLDDLAYKCAAKGASTDNSNLSRIENGQQVPRPRLRAVIAEILGLDVTYFEQSSPAEGDAA